MSGWEVSTGDHEIAFDAYGVRLAVGASRSELLDRVHLLLPPGSTPCSSSTVEHRFVITAEETGTYGVARDGKALTQGVDLEFALTLLDSQLRLYVGLMAPEAIFVHAGVVAHHGTTIVMPATSFAGKTTLVAALVRAGAIYYSDEFAVVDEQGLVHPYAKSLSLRVGDERQTDYPIDTLGGVSGEEPLPLGAIVVTSFRPDAAWEPRRLSAGEGAMALLANAVPARERPAQVLRALSRAADGAVVIESDRGEADAIAPLLLAELEQSIISPPPSNGPSRGP
jgi:hypothetical protein